jgi:phospholipid transport system substrate-binding protein
MAEVSKTAKTARRAIRALSFAIGVALALALVAAEVQAATPDAADVVRGFYAALLQTMQRGPALRASRRYDKLEPAVRATFDVGFMTRLAVSPSRGSLSPTQQQGITDAFEHYIAATYADRLIAVLNKKSNLLSGAMRNSS